MTVGAEIGKEIEAMVPGASETGIAVRIIGAILLAAAISFVVWKLFFSEHAAQDKHNAVQLQATQGIGQAGIKSGKEAIQITVDNGKVAAGIDAAIKGALNEIARAKGADSEIDAGVDGVGRRAICMRSSASGLPECQSMQRSGP